MGFTKPDLPKVDPGTFMQQLLMHRMKVLALHWVERGFGTPRMVHVIYIAKLLTFYILGGVVIATAHHACPRSGTWRSGGISRSCTRRRCCGRCCWRPWGGRVMGPAGGQVQADDRRHPVLGTDRHDPAAAVEAGSAHGR